MTEVTFDEFELKRKFGPRIIHFGTNTLLEAASAISNNEAAKVWDSIKTIIKTINPITCVGFKSNLLWYSSLNRIRPPNPCGMFTLLSAMIYKEIDSF